jgi:hypothetical protein
MRFLSFALAIAASLCCGSAAADVHDSIGLDPRDSALAGSTAARPGRFSAVWSNPAGLVRDGDGRGFAELSLGMIYAHPSLHVASLDGRPIAPDATVADVAGAVLGARFDLGRAFGLEGLGAGLALYVPNDIFRWSIRPDERVTWLFATDQSQHLGIHGGLGYRITRWLSAGASLRVLFDTETFTTGRVTEVRRTVDPRTGASGFEVGTQLGEEVAVYGRVAPTLGVQITPSDALALGLVYRHPLYVDDWGWTRIQGAPGAGDLGYVHRFAHYYQPLELSAAVSGRIGTVRLSADATYRRWSDALTTNHASLGPGRFGDTVVPAFGVSWEARPGFVVMGGYRFVKSPFDNFGGPTNLLDADQHVTSMGADVTLGRVDNVAFALRASYQISWLVTREEIKDPRRFRDDREILTNPGYPGYRFGGSISAGSAAVEARW